MTTVLRVLSYNVRSLRDDPAARQAVYDFLRTGDTTALPVAVALPVPGFGIPSFPPPRQGAGTAGPSTR